MGINEIIVTLSDMTRQQKQWCSSNFKETLCHGAACLSHSCKMSAHASLLEPLNIQGYNSSSANISWNGFFAERTNFSLGDLSTEEGWHEAITGAANFVAMLWLSNHSVTKFTSVIKLLFLLGEIWEGKDSTETFLKTWTLSVLFKVYPREMKTIHGNFQHAAILPW